jgi:hypothetical protein
MNLSVQTPDEWLAALAKPNLEMVSQFVLAPEDWLVICGVLRTGYWPFYKVQFRFSGHSMSSSSATSPFSHKQVGCNPGNHRACGH